MPDKEDKTIGDDIERIRYFRNDIAHAKHVSMSETTAAENWETAFGIGERIGKRLNCSYEEDIRKCQMKTFISEPEKKLIQVRREMKKGKFSLTVTVQLKLQSGETNQNETKSANLNMLQEHAVKTLNKITSEITNKSKESKIGNILHALRQELEHLDLDDTEETPEVRESGILNNLKDSTFNCAKEKRNGYPIFSKFVNFVIKWCKKYYCKIKHSFGSIIFYFKFPSCAEFDLFLYDLEEREIDRNVRELLLFPPLLSFFKLQDSDISLDVSKSYTEEELFENSSDESTVKETDDGIDDCEEYGLLFEKQNLEDTNDLLSFKETVRDLCQKVFKKGNDSLLQKYLMPMKQVFGFIRKHAQRYYLFFKNIWIEETEKLLEGDTKEKIVGFEELRLEVIELLHELVSIMDMLPSEQKSIKESLKAVHSRMQLFIESISTDKEEQRITIIIDSRNTITSTPIEGLSLTMWENPEKQTIPALDKSLSQTFITGVYKFTKKNKTPIAVRSKNMVFVRLEMIDVQKSDHKEWVSQVFFNKNWIKVQTLVQENSICFVTEEVESFYILESAKEVPVTMDPKGGVYTHASDPRLQIKIPEGAVTERQVSKVSVTEPEVSPSSLFQLISKVVQAEGSFLKALEVFYPCLLTNTSELSDMVLAYFDYNYATEIFRYDCKRTIHVEHNCFSTEVMAFSETGIIGISRNRLQTLTPLSASGEYQLERGILFKCHTLTFLLKDRESFAYLWCDIVQTDKIDERRKMMKKNHPTFEEIKLAESCDLYLKDDERIRVQIDGNFSINKQLTRYPNHNIIRFNVSRTGTDNHIIIRLMRTTAGKPFSDIIYLRDAGNDKLLWKISVDIASAKLTTKGPLQRQKSKEGSKFDEFKHFLQKSGLSELTDVLIENDIDCLQVFLALGEKEMKEELNLNIGQRIKCIEAIKKYKEFQQRN
ncbi:uncharacterized protein LOC134242860 [Saccostrea cucullata]|uniref:uncharacterized protein LOC134242860 n=1 Tax=Saccostrea cuccullata TaxID=36930 RepID=UPI002ED65634